MTKRLECAIIKTKGAIMSNKIEEKIRQAIEAGYSKYDIARYLNRLDFYSLSNKDILSISRKYATFLTKDSIRTITNILVESNDPKACWNFITQVLRPRSDISRPRYMTIAELRDKEKVIINIPYMANIRGLESVILREGDAETNLQYAILIQNQDIDDQSQIVHHEWAVLRAKDSDASIKFATEIESSHIQLHIDVLNDNGDTDAIETLRLLKEYRNKNHITKHDLYYDESGATANS